MWGTECPDHPDIARAMREGDPEAAPVYCPVCGAEFETVAKYLEDGLQDFVNSCDVVIAL